jgi:hypothetical protein
VFFLVPLYSPQIQHGLSLLSFHKINGVTETKGIRWTERALKYEGNATLEALVITKLHLQVLGSEGQVLTL